MNKKNIFIIYFFILFFLISCLINIISCRRKKVIPPPPPTPTNTPIPSMEKIVYTFNGNLYWINIDGSGKEILFPDNNSKWFPSASPSGWYIAYWVQTDSNYNLWIADLKNNKKMQLTFDEDGIESDVHNFKISNAPAWAADETFIIYARNKNIWKITKDGYNNEALTFTHNCISPSLSSNNRLVYVKIESPETWNLYIRDIDALNEEKLTNYYKKKASSPCISSDGQKVIFSLSYGDNIDIMLLDINTKLTTQLSFDGKSLTPRFSSNNLKIVYSNFIDNKYQPEIWVMNINQSERNKLTFDGGHSPSWLYRILSDPLPTPILIREEKDEKYDKIQEPVIIETPLVEEKPKQREIQPSIQLAADDLTIKLIRQDDSLLFYPLIHFDSGFANIKNEFYKVLDDMIVIINKSRSPILIYGHTDNVPIRTKQFPSNYELSLERANQVKEYMIKKGVDPKRITISGYGDSRPLLPNNTKENRYKNRRAEVTLKITPLDENYLINFLITPTLTEQQKTPTPEPTVTPTPIPSRKNIIDNIINKFFKNNSTKSRAKSW